MHVGTRHAVVVLFVTSCAPQPVTVAPAVTPSAADASTSAPAIAADDDARSDDAIATRTSEPPGSASPRANAPLPPRRTFTRDERAPVGLTELEIADYNAAQGDPHVGPFELADAWKGDPALAESRRGPLVAIVRTSLGDFECVLFEDEVPRTVANFVGLARGTRPALDPKDSAWKTMRFYDGVAFHRVVAGFVVQTGDRHGTGSGDTGYVIADEPGRGRQHASVGTLAMAHRGKNTGSSQFYVTLAAAPHLDGLFTVFGECEADVPLAIGRVKVDPKTHRPKKRVTVTTIDIVRKPTPARMPDVGPPLPRKR